MTDVTPAADPPPGVAVPARRDVPVGVVMVGLSVVAWWPAFTLGAWHTLFFDQLLTLWAASTAAFVFVLVERRPVGARLARAFVLVLPSIWLLLSFIVDDDSTNLAIALLDLFAFITVIVGIPFTVWVLVGIMWPDLGGTIRRRTRWLVVLVVLAVSLISFVLGAANSLFMTCEDFTISGNSEPPTCVKAADN